MERTKRMFYFAVGDVIAKRDLLGLFPQSDYATAEELYNAYEEKISRITEEICRDDGWKKAHWTKILQAIKTAFGPELDRDDGGRSPSAMQKEMIETAREIQAAIFQSPAYYPELLQCSNEEKEECLKTVISLYRLWDHMRQQGSLALFVPNAPLLNACFDLPEHDIDGIRRIEKIFRQCMVTEGYSGGKLLNNAVAAEGTLLYLRWSEKPFAYPMSRAQWGQELCDAIKVLFGPDFEGRVEACIEQEAKMHFSSDEEIPLEPLSIDWPKIESWEIEDEKAAHIRFCAVEETLRESGHLPQWEEAGPETVRKMARIAEQIRPQNTVTQMIKILNGAGFYIDHLDTPKAALLEIPPYLSRQMQMEKEEKEKFLESAAKIFRVAFDMKEKDSECLWYDGWDQWIYEMFAGKETDEIFQGMLREVQSKLRDGERTPDAQKFRKENMKCVVFNCGDDDDNEGIGWRKYKNFAEYRMIVEGLSYLLENPAPCLNDLCCVVKSMLGLEYAEQVDQILKDEKKAYRRHGKRRSSPSTIPEFDKLLKLPWNKCVEIFNEIPENTLAYALKGTGGELEELICRSLHEEKRQEVEDDLDMTLLVRLKDVEEAQRAILEKARQMFGENCLSDRGDLPAFDRTEKESKTDHSDHGYRF